MLNPEYYVGEYRRPDGSWATAKFADQARRLGGAAVPPQWQGTPTVLPLACRRVST